MPDKNFLRLTKINKQKSIQNTEYDMVYTSEHG